MEYRTIKAILNARKVLHARVTGGLMIFHGRWSNGGAMPESLGLFAWLFTDAIKSRLTAQIEAAATNNDGLMEQQRHVRQRVLAAEVLEAERHECSLIEAAEKEGTLIPLRADVDV